MNAVIIILRLIHIFGGIMWVGGAFLLTHVVQPVTMQGGPEGQRWLVRIVSSEKLGKYMGLAAMLTVLAGIVLYILVSGGFNMGWITSGPGLVLTLGTVCGIIAMVIGFAVVSKNSAKIGALSQEIQAAGGPPPADKLAALQALVAQQKRVGQIDEVLMIVTVATMIIAYNL
jgi:uncharacterized membrane protein